MTSNLSNVQKKYNRVSRFYDIIEWPIEKLLFQKWRKRLLKNIEGKVLEVGIGTGKNLEHYNYNKVELIGVDISEGMLEKAQRKVDKHHYPTKLQLIGSERLPFEDNYFDYVVCTFVLCSVPDPAITLNEMKRVVKKEGRIVMLEHVLSKYRPIAFFENLHNPITSYLFGFNVNRDTVGTIKKCGLNVVKEKNLALFDVFKELGVEK